MAKKSNIAVFHTKMIIGGGERLLIDMAKALQNEGHTLTIFVNEHNKQKCFEETIDGTVKVETVPTSFPSKIFGHLSHICFIIQFLIIILKTLMFKKEKFDLVIVDEHPFVIPFIRLFRKKVIYYMHYPVKLVGESQKGGSKFIFFFLGLFEEFSLLFASKIFVNSKFIFQLYSRYFKIAMFFKQIPEVLYPIGNYSNNNSKKTEFDGYKDVPIIKHKNFFFSANRICPNKNLILAIEAFSKLPKNEYNENVLVLAGGLANEPKYMEYLGLMKQTIVEKGMTGKVIILPNISQDLLLFLYSKCLCVLYTPVNEHFGIIPIEAQSYGCVVLAQNSGGPLETVGESSGFVLPDRVEDWSNKMSWVLNNKEKVDQMKKKGPLHVESKFSFKVFADVWAKTVQSLVK